LPTIVDPIPRVGVGTTVGVEVSVGGAEVAVGGTGVSVSGNAVASGVVVAGEPHAVSRVITKMTDISRLLVFILLQSYFVQVRKTVNA